jgi:hypothetical protein
MEINIKTSELLEHYDYYINELDEFDYQMTFDEWRLQFEDIIKLIIINN